MEIDALALSWNVAGGAVDLSADAVLAVLAHSAALLMEGAEAVRRIVGVPATFYMDPRLREKPRQCQAELTIMSKSCLSPDS